MFKHMEKYLNVICLNINMTEININTSIYVRKDWDDKVNKYCEETARNKSKLIQISVEKYMEENK